MSATVDIERRRFSAKEYDRMGEVYEATDMLHDRTVAIEVLLEPLASQAASDSLLRKSSNASRP